MTAPLRLGFITRHPPYGRHRAHEMFDAALTAAALMADVHLIFLDDGIYQLLTGQHSAPLGQRPLTDLLEMLEDSDIEHFWTDAETLARRGLSAEDLLLPVSVLSSPDLAARLADLDQVITL